jgi:hypothetical protein
LLKVRIVQRVNDQSDFILSNPLKSPYPHLNQFDGVISHGMRNHIK